MSLPLFSGVSNGQEMLKQDEIEQKRKELRIKRESHLGCYPNMAFLAILGSEGLMHVPGSVVTSRRRIYFLRFSVVFVPFK